MSNKDLAAELTKTYIQAYVHGVLSDQNAVLGAKVMAVSPSKITEAYKQFYKMLSSTPDEE